MQKGFCNVGFRMRTYIREERPTSDKLSFELVPFRETEWNGGS